MQDSIFNGRLAWTHMQIEFKVCMDRIRRKKSGSPYQTLSVLVYNFSICKLLK